MILYTDKSELFECNISVDGTSINNTKTRLVVEGPQWNLVFYGNIDHHGKCSIDIDKLHILKEGDEGKMRLEVIADDSYFIPWEDSFTVKKSKRVTVEVFDKTNPNSSTPSKAKVLVSNTPATDSTMSEIKQITQNEIKSMTKSLNEGSVKEAIDKLKNNNITLQNFHKNEGLFEKIISETVTKYNINSADNRKHFVKSILDFLAK
jgi:hypothetical protein